MSFEESNMSALFLPTTAECPGEWDRVVIYNAPDAQGNAVHCEIVNTDGEFDASSWRNVIVRFMLQRPISPVLIAYGDSFSMLNENDVFAMQVCYPHRVVPHPDVFAGTLESHEYDPLTQEFNRE